MYIGVDGGGTKTAFILMDKECNILATYQSDTGSYLAVGIEGVRTTLSQGISYILSSANADISDVNYAFFGLPCYGEDQTMQQTLDLLPATIMDKDKYSCNNDTVCGWAGSLACADGINIVAGTGSISYGQNKGTSARCGGWGELFGDEGSGYWISREGLNVFTKMADGRLTPGPLHTLLKQHLDLDRDLDLPGIVLDQWLGERRKIAAISTVVCEAARAGDIHAIDIYNRAGIELAEIVEATRRQAKFDNDETVKLSYSGGIFNSEDMILEPLIKALKSNYTLLKPRFSPAIGAALYAAKLDGRSFSEQILSNLD